MPCDLIDSDYCGIGCAASADGCTMEMIGPIFMIAAPIVLDTNVFIAAGFNPASASAHLLAAVHNRQIRMIW